MCHDKPNSFDFQFQLFPTTLIMSEKQLAHPFEKNGYLSLYKERAHSQGFQFQFSYGAVII